MIWRAHPRPRLPKAIKHAWAHPRRRARQQTIPRHFFAWHSFVRISSSAFLNCVFFSPTHFFFYAKLRPKIFVYANICLRISSSGNLQSTQILICTYLCPDIFVNVYLRPQVNSSAQIFVFAYLRQPISLFRIFCPEIFVPANLCPQFIICANIRLQIFDQLAYFAFATKERRYQEMLLSNKPNGRRFPGTKILDEEMRPNNAPTKICWRNYANTNICADEELQTNTYIYFGEDLQTMICADERFRRLRFADEDMRRRRFADTKKCYAY